MTKADKHMAICEKLNEIYKQKSAAYGDSFSETFGKLGIVSAVTRITDKHNRIVNLVGHKDVDMGDESIRDTLLDMANYCIMTVMEMDAKQSSDVVTGFREWTERYNAMRSNRQRIEDASRGVQA